MASTENSLLAKWSTSGLSSSLLSSTLLSSKSDAKSGLDSPPRKRKPARGKSAEAIEKKKPKDEKDKKSSLQSSLLSTGTTGSSLLQSSGSLLGYSSVGMTTRSSLSSTSANKGSSFTGGSSLLSKSGLTSSFGLSKGKSSDGGANLSSNLRPSTLSKSSLSSSRTSSSALSSSLFSSGLVSSSLSSSQKTTSRPSDSILSSSYRQSSSTQLVQGSSYLTSHSADKVTLVGGSSLSSGLLRSTSLLSKESNETKKSTKSKKKEEKGKKRTRLDRYDAPPPHYDLTNEETKKEHEIVIPRFVHPFKDKNLLLTGVRLHDVNGLKFALVNAVSGSLICQPNFSLGTDPTRVALVTMSQKVICYDPEFILKVALYTRKQLNIRTTGNFLLAMASHIPACRPYLKKYYSAAIALPSDWIEVAEIYQAFPERTLELGSLPAALRRAMVVKFPDFDKYQLAKYNKESSKKKKKKKAKKMEAMQTNAWDGGRGRGGRGGRGMGRGRGRGRGRGAAQRGGREDGFPATRKTIVDSDSSSSGSEIDSDEEYEKFRQDELKGLSTVKFDDKETPEELAKTSFSLKQLIRKLHITEPVEHVMCLIGKKYPNSLDEFYRSRLPGTFEEERSGKRMKLPVPETWETQVSLKGNKASTWEQLLDHKKLPFMAMLRNLRNLIKAGISQKHHNWVLRKLTDERSVIYSKQFPFRFFSAYEVLEQLTKDFEKNQEKLVSEAVLAEANGEAGKPSVRGARGGRGGRGERGGKSEKLTKDNWWILKKQRKTEKQKTVETPFDTALINRYRKALDTAVKIATVYNVSPIRGRTVILCDVGPNMKTPCTAARGLGKPRTMQEVSVLLGLMCKYSCEECVLVIFDSSVEKYCTVELDKGTILENMSTVLSKELIDVPGLFKFESGLPVPVLLEHLRDRIQIDNLLLLTGGGEMSAQRRLVAAILDNYRLLVNPDLLYVNVSFAGNACGFATDIKPEHENNIYISGFSDQILRFIAERGDGGQLRHVEMIDEAFNLKPLPAVMGDKPATPNLTVARPLQLTSQTPHWRSARVFISSTFRDMHGERDMLTRFVFPELRALGKKHFINVHEVDLRWGVTEEDTRSNKTLELCLSEIKKCQFFVGMLGERYGWVPEKYIVPNVPEFDWVRAYPAGASVTELEMHSAALHSPADMRDHAFFFLRDSTFESEIPKDYRDDFMSESSSNTTKMAALKLKIKKSGLEVFDRYKCQWGGVIDGKPIVSGLDDFGARALNNLWNAIQKQFPDEASTLDEASHITKLHDAYIADQKSQFVGRKKLIKDSIKRIPELQTGVVSLVGKPGTGKSALLASLVSEYVGSKACDNIATILTHFAGAAPGSTNILATLRRLCHELNYRFSLGMEVPEDYKNIVPKFRDMLTESAQMCGSPLVLFIDGIDVMDPAYLPHNLDWVPENIPKNVVFVVTCLTDGKLHQSLKRRKVTEVVVEGLDMWDKADVVRSNLAKHRKSLDESSFNNQMKLLVSKKEANIPLFLSLACEELRVFGLFEKITPKLKSLPQTVPLLLQEVMTRMESDLGRDLVSSALSLLVCARDGLEAGELHDLLTLLRILGNERPKVKEILNMRPSPEECLPSATFAQLQRALAGFLNPNQTLTSRLSLAHADINNAVRQRYFKSSAAMETELFLHRLIAGYMYSLADPDRDGSWKGKIGRAFQELSYHLIRSGSFSELEHVVCNLRFVYNKSMLGLASHLIDDYQPLELNKTLAREQAKCMEKLCVNEYRSFVSRNLHILASHPALTWQQAFNEKSSSQPAVDVRTILQTTSLPDSERNLMEWSSKPVNVDPCYMTISNLPQPMTSVSVSPDNLYFACGGLDGVVHLYDFKTGKELKSFRGHADSITDVCFAGRDKLCSASMDNVVSIWDVENGHRLFALKRHQRRVNSCASDLSGKLLATASWDCMIKVWSVKKGEEVCEFKVGSPVNCVAFHPEGQLIVSGQWDSTIKIWDVFHKTKKAVLRGHKSSVRDVAYSPSGRHIASAALDGDVKLWAAYAGSQVGNIHGHALPINKLIFSPTGQELITVSDDHKIKVWSGHLGQPISTLGQEDLGPTMSVSISPSRETVAVGYHSGYIRIYNILSGSEVQGSKVHTASVKCLKYMSESYLMSGSDDNTVMILKTNLKKACVIAEHTKPVMCVDICRDYMATASEDCTCRLYENPLKFGGKPQMTETTRICILGGHTGPVTSCSFNRDGTMIATSSRDMTVKIWDVVDVGLNADNPTPIQILQDCHADWVTDCKWSNIGDSLVTASSDFNLKVWDTRNGKEKMKMTGHMGSVNHVGYSYGCIMSTCSDGSVKMWSHKGVEITTLYGHTQRANGCDISVQLSEDDKQNVQDDWSSYGLQDKKVLQPKLENVIVATCSDDGTARLWYPMQANELACLTGHSDKVIAVSSSSQGQLCTSSLDNSIKLWSCDQESRAVIGCHDTPVTFISSLLGGTAVFTGSRNGNIKILESELVTVNGQQHLKYSCSISIKAHEMAVTCGSWLGPNNLVTGSDDCSIVIWTVTRTNGKISRLTKNKTWFTKSPLLSLVTNGDDKVTAMANTFIFTSEWDGALKAWNTTGKMVAELHTLYSFTEWLLKLHMDGSDKLLATTTDGYVIKYSVEKVVQKNAKPTITEIMKIRIPMGRDIVSTRNVEAHWVLAVSGNERGFFTGDSVGQVTCMTKRGYEYHPKQSMKIHSAELSCVVKTEKYLFTASRDKTIKVWDGSMSQVGQFFCASPVTSMKVLDGSLMQFVPILYGDELGYIHLLLWRTGHQ